MTKKRQIAIYANEDLYEVLNQVRAKYKLPSNSSAVQFALARLLSSDDTITHEHEHDELPKSKTLEVNEQKRYLEKLIVSQIELAEQKLEVKVYRALMASIKEELPDLILEAVKAMFKG